MALWPELPPLQGLCQVVTDHESFPGVSFLELGCIIGIKGHLCLPELLALARGRLANPRCLVTSSFVNEHAVKVIFQAC